MMKHLLTLTALLIICASSFGQVQKSGEGLILFHGLLMDAGSGTPLPNSQIFINSAFASLSNSEGKFAFYVNRRDTVVFRSLGYKQAEIQISDTLRGKEFVAGIFMNTDTLVIPAVIIMPRIASLRSDIMRPGRGSDQQLDNARYNLAVSAYQGRVNQGRLGDPAMNYEMIRQQQREDAYSKGQIPSDRLVGLSPFMLIPAAYLLMNGLPQKPVMVQPVLTDSEAEMIFRKYLELKKD